MKNKIQKLFFSSTLILLIASCLLPTASIAQTQGPLNGSTFANSASFGTVAWSNVNDANTSNNVYATVDLSSCPLLTSNYLTVTNFSFSIPAATIDGIQVEVERSYSTCGDYCLSTLTQMSDTIVRLVKGGIVVGANKAVGSTLPASDTYRTYGNSTDLWGTTWTPSDVNASNFGMVIALRHAVAITNAIASIDHVRITIYYTVDLPVTLLYFNAQPENNCLVRCEWATASEQNNDYFTIEKGTSELLFIPIGSVNGAGNSSTIRKYEFVDNEPHTFTSTFYYRLKQTDYDGKYAYSPIASLRFPCQDEGIILLPNPSSGIFSVTGLSPNSEFSVFNVLGEKVYQSATYNQKFEIDLGKQPNGIYFINISASSDPSSGGKTEIEAYTQKLIIQK